MRLKLIVLVLCCLFKVSDTWAKKIPKNPMKWGKIPEADLKMTTYEQDPEAAAVVLGEFGSIKHFVENGYVKFEYSFHVRVKILKASAIDDYGFFEIEYTAKPYTNYLSSIKLVQMKAHSFTPDGEKHKPKSKNIFTEKKNKTTRIKKVTFPNLQVGSVIEYKYIIESFASSNIPTWYFQQSIPVRISRFNTEVAEGLLFVYDLKGKEYMRKNEDGSFTYLGVSKFEIVDNRSFTMENLQALKGEDYITTLKDYWAGISFYLESSELSGEKKVYLGDWDNFATKRRASEYFGQEYLSKNNYIEVVKAAEFIYQNDQLSKREKIDAFYNFVNEKVEWDNYYSTQSYGLNDAFKEKEGTSAEINLMLLALLRTAGIEANPLFISTRGHGKVLESYPFGKQFNHILVHVELDGETLFLDGRNKLRPVGFPSVNALNKRAWLLRDTSHEWIDIPTPKASSIYLVNAALKENGDLSGSMKSAYDGYHALAERMLFKAKKAKENWKNKLIDKYPEIKIDSLHFENEKDVNQLFKNETQYLVPEFAQVSGDLMYVSPAFYSLYSENKLKQEKRIYPVDFPYPFKEQLVVNLKIPPGYAVEELPEAANLALPNKGGRFQYFVKEKDGVIQLVSKLTINQLFYQPQEYSTLKKLFDLVVEKHGEQLVLKKIN